jgi:hypothetical protein
VSTQPATARHNVVTPFAYSFHAVNLDAAGRVPLGRALRSLGLPAAADLDAHVQVVYGRNRGVDRIVVDDAGPITTLRSGGLALKFGQQTPPPGTTASVGLGGVTTPAGHDVPTCVVVYPGRTAKSPNEGLTLSRLVLDQPETQRVFRGATVIEPLHCVSPADLWLVSIQPAIEVAFGAIYHSLLEMREIEDDHAHEMRQRLAAVNDEMRRPAVDRSRVQVSLLAIVGLIGTFVMGVSTSLAASAIWEVHRDYIVAMIHRFF